MCQLPLRFLRIVSVAVGLAAFAPQEVNEATPVATFSIVAYDPATQDVGVAVESKFFSVGPVVPWVESGVGAIATQAFANVTYGPRGLELLRMGLAPEQVGKLLTEADPQRDRRQIGIVDVNGRAYTYTGERCTPWAGGRSGKDSQGRAYAVQGNILTGEEVVLAMEKAFLESSGELADKLLAALAAGQQAGGDSRGQQSAALVVMRPRGGYAGMNDRYVDLRVEDHPRPIEELARLWGIRKAMNYMAEAGRALQQENLQEAWQWLAKALQAAPGYPDLHYAVARYHARAGNVDEALEWLSKAIQANPQFRLSARRDKAFEPLRQNPSFQKLLEP